MTARVVKGQLFFYYTKMFAGKATFKIISTKKGGKAPG